MRLSGVGHFACRGMETLLWCVDESPVRNRSPNCNAQPAAKSAARSGTRLRIEGTNVRLAAIPSQETPPPGASSRL
jgi:hypothetical protein